MCGILPEAASGQSGLLLGRKKWWRNVIGEPLQQESAIDQQPLLQPDALMIFGLYQQAAVPVPTGLDFQEAQLFTRRRQSLESSPGSLFPPPAVGPLIGEGRARGSDSCQAQLPAVPQPEGIAGDDGLHHGFLGVAPVGCFGGGGTDACEKKQEERKGAKHGGECRQPPVPSASRPLLLHAVHPPSACYDRGAALEETVCRATTSFPPSSPMRVGGCASVRGTSFIGS